MSTENKDTIACMEEKAQEIKKQVGQALKAKREKLGYSKYKVSKLSGLSATQVTAIEEGVKDCTLPSVVRLGLTVGLKFSLENNQIIESGILKLDL